MQAKKPRPFHNDIGSKEKLLLWLWVIFTVLMSSFISFVFFLIWSFGFSEKHNLSTAGDHAITERGIILTDILGALGLMAMAVGFLGSFAFFVHQEVCLFLLKPDRRYRDRYKLDRLTHRFSSIGLKLWGLSLLILCLGPMLACADYYRERAQYFPLAETVTANPTA